MMDLDSLREIGETLARNRLRALLTGSGVFWGACLLVLMLGIGTGLERGVIRNLSGLGNYSLYIWPGRTSLPYRGWKPGRYIEFRNADIAAIARTPGVECVAPRLQLGSWREGQNVTFGAKKANFNIMGDSPELTSVEPLSFESGRFIDPTDMAEQRKVVVIGAEVKRTLFGDADPVGRLIQIKRMNFRVIGVLRTRRTGDEGERMLASVYLPLSTFQTVFNLQDHVGWFAVSARRSVPAALVEQAVRSALTTAHQIAPADFLALGSYNSAEKFEQLQGLFRAIRKFIWLVGTLTLLAGMLGVSNILLVTVKERTKELGVRKALGATPGSIVSLVVAEGLLLTGLAGYSAIVAGVFGLEVIGRALHEFPDAPLVQPQIDLRVALGAALVLTISAALASVVPARHAARIHPVAALRAE